MTEITFIFCRIPPLCKIFVTGAVGGLVGANYYSPGVVGGGGNEFFNNTTTGENYMRDEIITYQNNNRHPNVGSTDIGKCLDDSDWRGLAACSDSAAREKLDYSIAGKLGVLPLKVTVLNNKQALLVAIPRSREDVQDQVIKAVSFATGEVIVPTYGSAECLNKAVFFAYRGSEEILEQAVSDVALATTAGASAVEASIADSAREKSAEISAVPKLLKTLLERAINMNASDIHIEPGKQTCRVRLRVDGILREEKKLGISKYACEQLVRRIKVLSKLDTVKQHECLEGAFSFDNAAWSMRLRVSIMPTLFGEKAVIRLLNNRFLDELLERANNSPNGAASYSPLQRPDNEIFRALGMKSHKDVSQLKFHLGANEGVIVTTGATGSGKSTLLYACLEYLNTPGKNIVTIEDPAERVIGGISQIEISEQNGHSLSASALLKGVLRQDPDILLVGEIRDAEVAQTALVGGITGHLVLTSMHAANCVEALNRFWQMGIDRQLVAAALKLIISQKLLAKNCPHCVREAKPSEELKRFLNIDDGAKLYESVGCERCGGTGVLGRICVFEQISMSPKLQEAICGGGVSSGGAGCGGGGDDAGSAGGGASRVGGSGNFAGNFRKVALEQGYVPLVFSIRDELLNGTVSPKVALAAMGLAPDVFL